MELEAEVAKLKEQNDELQKKQVYLLCFVTDFVFFPLKNYKFDFIVVCTSFVCFPYQFMASCTQYVVLR